MTQIDLVRDAEMPEDVARILRQAARLYHTQTIHAKHLDEFEEALTWEIIACILEDTAELVDDTL